jgi:hypothetical protein
MSDINLNGVICPKNYLLKSDPGLSSVYKRIHLYFKSTLQRFTVTSEKISLADKVTIIREDIMSYPSLRSFFFPNKSSLLRLRDSYRHLKSLSKKLNNTIDFLNFSKNEMRIHWRLTLWYGWEWLSSETYRTKPQELLIIGSNYFASKFGLSLFRPIFWLFFLHLVLFYKLETTVFDKKVFFQLGGPIDWNFWDKYFYYLNPIRKIAEHQETLPKFLTYDFFIRLSSSYFIWHIIKASRKYSGGGSD